MLSVFQVSRMLKWQRLQSRTAAGALLGSVMVAWAMRRGVGCRPTTLTEDAAGRARDLRRGNHVT